MKKHHKDLAWSSAMFLVCAWSAYTDSWRWALFLAGGAGYFLSESLNEWQRYYERLAGGDHV